MQMRLREGVWDGDAVRVAAVTDAPACATALSGKKIRVDAPLFKIDMRKKSTAIIT